jgi:hypothetical protein
MSGSIRGLPPTAGRRSRRFAARRPERPGLLQRVWPPGMGRMPGSRIPSRPSSRRRP